jgi:hypothetical protein
MSCGDPASDPFSTDAVGLAFVAVLFAWNARRWNSRSPKKCPQRGKTGTIPDGTCTACGSFARKDLWR